MSELWRILFWVLLVMGQGVAEASPVTPLLVDIKSSWTESDTVLNICITNNGNDFSIYKGDLPWVTNNYRDFVLVPEEHSERIQTEAKAPDDAGPEILPFKKGQTLCGNIQLSKIFQKPLRAGKKYLLTWRLTLNHVKENVTSNAVGSIEIDTEMQKKQKVLTVKETENWFAIHCTKRYPSFNIFFPGEKNVQDIKIEAEKIVRADDRLTWVDSLPVKIRYFQTTIEVSDEGAKVNGNPIVDLKDPIMVFRDKEFESFELSIVGM